MELRELYKQTEVGIIPEDWEIKLLGNVCQIFGRIGFRGYTIQDIVEKEQGAITISPSNIKNSKMDFSNCTYISWFKYEESPEIKIFNGDILLVKTGSTFGKTAIIKKLNDKATINPQLVVLKKITIDKIFLGYVMGFNIIQNQISNSIVGGAIPTLSQEQIAKFKFPLPPNPEQTTIATTLSDTDALIENLEKLIAKKSYIMHGAMQELLEGKRRLCGFQGEWNVRMLGEIVEIKKGQLITEKTAIHGYIPVIAGGIAPSYYHNRPNRKGNTVTISASGANAGFVAFHEKPIFASDCSTIEENPDIEVKFIYFSLLLSQQSIFNLQVGGAQPHVYPEQIKTFEIPIPKNKDEQAAIASIISDMDFEIDALEQKLHKYRMIKQGMMQVLLTGKIRLI